MIFFFFKILFLANLMKMYVLIRFFIYFERDEVMGNLQSYDFYFYKLISNNVFCFFLDKRNLIILNSKKRKKLFVRDSPNKSNSKNPVSDNGNKEYLFRET